MLTHLKGKVDQDFPNVSGPDTEQPNSQEILDLLAKKSRRMQTPLHASLCTVLLPVQEDHMLTHLFLHLQACECAVMLAFQHQHC